MVVCKFFLQGTCKFGQNCKYEHQLNDNTQAYSTSILRQQQQQQQNPNSIDTNTLIRAVQNDMLNAEKGGQWLLSSYAPFKDKPAFPGFEDKSFEEVRLGFYEATKNRVADQFTLQLQMALKDAATKIKALQNPSPEAVNMLTQIYNTPVSNGNFGTSQAYDTNNMFPQSSNFTANTNKNMFDQNGQSVFDQIQTVAQPMFGGNTNQNIFGNTVQNSVFGSTSPQVQSRTSIFGGTQQTPNQTIFGGTQTSSNNMFVQQKSPSFSQPQGFSGPNSIFSGSQQNNVFGSQINPFGGQSASVSPFGATQANTSPPFGATQANTSPSFGASPANANSPFRATQASTTSPFSVQAIGNSPFGMQKQTTSPFVSSGFLSQPTQSTSVFAQTASQFSASQPSPFGTHQPQQSLAPFNSQQNSTYVSNSPFGVQHSQASSPFNTQQQQVATSLFNKQPETTSVFAGAQQQAALGAFTGHQQAVGSSIFANANSNNSSNSIFSQPPGATAANSIFGSSPTTASLQHPNRDESAYSKLEELSESDIKAFESECFEFGKIPEKPPTVQMCF